MTFQTLARHNTLRRTASLLIRCLDCEGELIANVAWVNGWPKIAAKGAGQSIGWNGRRRHYWVYSWADRGTVLTARLGPHQHEIPRADVLAHLPPAGAPRAEMKIRHTTPS